MLFQEIVGQETLKEKFIQLYNNGRVPHASLILGKEGWGGLSMALAFAQYLMCEQKGSEDSCGVCSNCVQVRKMEHPDLKFSFPTVSPKPNTKNYSENYIAEFRDFVKQSPYGTTFDWFQYIKVENKQGNISADEARAIVDSMNLKSYQGGSKIYIIWRPEFLGKEGNILLKLIEEPAPNTFLIFVAEEEQKIISTILSRLQLFKLSPIPAQTLASALVSRYQIGEELAQQIALAAEGSYTEALYLKDNWDNDMLPIMTTWLNATYSNNGLSIMEWVDVQSKLGREELKNLIQYMQQIFAASMRIRYSPKLKVALADNDRALAQKIANMNLPMEIYIQLEDYLTKVVYNISRNVNHKSLLLNLSIQMQYWIKGRQLQNVW